MADDGQQNADRNYERDTDETHSSDQSLFISEDADSRSVASTVEAGSQHETRCSSARPSSGGAFQGPHDWRKRLRPISNLDRLGNGCVSSDRKVKSPDDMRHRNGTDMRNISCYDRSLSFCSHCILHLHQLHLK